MRRDMTQTWLLVGLGAAGAALLLSSPEARTMITDTTDWVRRVIQRVSAHEGRYDSLNLNTDGAGLSMGIIQWSQKSGQLGKLLQAFHTHDRAKFAAVFGPQAAMLLSHTQSGSLAPVGGALLWQSPWKERFLQAGRYTPWQVVQDELAAAGEHMVAAQQCAAVLGIRTERAMVLFYDRAVQQGQSGAVRIARELAEKLQGTTLPGASILAAFAEACASRFRRTERPSDPGYGKNLMWKPVGNEWHVFAGQIDLFADITRRTTNILTDKKLSDAPLPTVNQGAQT